MNVPPVKCYQITLYILPKTRKNIHQNDIAFFSSLYYNRTCKKNLPFKNFFFSFKLSYYASSAFVPHLAPAQQSLFPLCTRKFYFAFCRTLSISVYFNFSSILYFLTFYFYKSRTLIFHFRLTFLFLAFFYSS